MPKKKIALLFICLNPPYWPFLKDVIEDARKNFLTNHQVDFFTWSDMPELDSKEFDSVINSLPTEEAIKELNNQAGALSEAQAISRQLPPAAKRISELVVDPQVRKICSQMIALSEGLDAVKGPDVNRLQSQETVRSSVEWLRNAKDITIFPTEPVQWPYPTLMRYHLFLQQEEKLKDYDYVFYLDADMRIVDTVTEEILGEGLTMAEHPMYSLRREYVPPYEPNSQSTAFIPRFGAVISTPDGKPWFKPFYAAGGFQGGTSESFITAMKEMRKNIDKDFNNNYTAIWNDESHWNKYLYGYGGQLKVLSPSYIFPDSLIEEYYKKTWGTTYKPIIVTLTKKFTTSKEAGADLKNRLSTM